MMNNTTEPLSLKKTEFLKAQVYNELPLTLDDVFVLAEDYSQKYNITIFVVGHLASKGIVVDQYFDEDNMNYTNDRKTTRDAVSNILSIQKTLTNNQCVGYLHGSLVAEDGWHFECFIISKNEIIKPVSWALSALGFDNHNVMGDFFLCAPDYRYSFIEPSYFLIPQADSTSCGSICLSYLKNLLRNNAQQLRDYSLSVPYYDQKYNQLHYVFIPTPSVLRYSQLSAYNQRIRELVECDNNESMSLVHMLKMCIKETKSSNKLHAAFKSKLIAEAQSHLNNLPAFKQKWLKEYERVHAKRELMHDQKNRYLTYTAHRFILKSYLIQQRLHNPALQFMHRFDTIPKELKKEFLHTELPKINFCNLYEVAYFLSKIEDEFRTHCFFLLKGNTFNPENWRAITLFLNDAQKEQLTNDLKNTNESGELLTKNASTFFSWLEIWQCTMEEKKYLIDLFVPIKIAGKPLLLSSYILNLLSNEVILEFKKHFDFPLWRLLQYIETHFPADIASDFLLCNRFLLIEDDLLEQLINATCLNAIIPTGPLQGLSLAYFLAASPQGLKRLISDEDRLYQLINATCLNAIIPTGPLLGQSLAYCLALKSEGVDVLNKDEGRLTRLITSKCLNTIISTGALQGQSLAYRLAASSEGLKILKNDDSRLARLIDRECLNSIIATGPNQGMSCAYFFAASSESIKLLKIDEGRLARLINRECLNSIVATGPNKGMSVVAWLVSLPEGINLLKSNRERLACLINDESLESIISIGPNKGLSVAYCMIAPTNNNKKQNIKFFGNFVHDSATLYDEEHNAASSCTLS